MKLLIVDDSATARMMIGKCVSIVSGGEAEIIEADNGLSALRRIAENMPELILTDYNMPGMNGEAFLKALKKDETLKVIPVVFITSTKNPKKEETLIEGGALQVLHKPVSPPAIAKLFHELKLLGNN